MSIMNIKEMKELKKLVSTKLWKQNVCPDCRHCICAIDSEQIKNCIDENLAAFSAAEFREYFLD